MHEFPSLQGLPTMSAIPIGPCSTALPGFKRVPYGDVPAPLAQRVLQRIRTDTSVISWTPEPNVFEWFDGLVGGMRRFTPRILVARGDGTLTFVATMDRASLLLDPELSGRRRHVEAECLALRATLEIWTEEEADAPSRTPLVLPAFGATRAGYMERRRPLDRRLPRIVEAVAAKLRLLGPAEVSGAWVAQCELTGIPMTILPGFRLDPATGAALWNPHLTEGTVNDFTSGMTISSEDLSRDGATFGSGEGAFSLGGNT